MPEARAFSVCYVRAAPESPLVEFRHCSQQRLRLLAQADFAKLDIRIITDEDATAFGTSAVSHAIVTLVGTSTFRQLKAIGQCVWAPSELSSGVNTVRVAENLRETWPSTPGGTLRFNKLRDLQKNLVGFEVCNN